jgi:Uma2 family endonuclease
MATVTIELPPQPEQTASNLRRWADLLENPELAKIEGRIETDRHGQIIMSPPPAPRHGRLQSRVAHLLESLLPEGETITECPISTADGVKAADVAWASAEAMRALGSRACFTRAPEICIEVLSPSNTPAEITEKATLYFDAGAQEVWVCATSGEVQFFAAPHAPGLPDSKLCPQFPSRIKLP